MAYTWDKANEKAESTRETQYFEVLGNRIPDEQHTAAAQSRSRPLD